MSAFLLLPKFKCFHESSPDELYDCKQKDFCHDGSLDEGVSFITQWDSVYSLYNWVPKLDLYCVKDIEMGLFGSLYFAGFLLGTVATVSHRERMTCLINRAETGRCVWSKEASGDSTLLPSMLDCCAVVGQELIGCLHRHGVLRSYLVRKVWNRIHSCNGVRL